MVTPNASWSFTSINVVPGPTQTQSPQGIGPDRVHAEVNFNWLPQLRIIHGPTLTE
jgi:hypothetical protein